MNILYYHFKEGRNRPQNGMASSKSCPGQMQNRELPLSPGPSASPAPSPPPPLTGAALPCCSELPVSLGSRHLLDTVTTMVVTMWPPGYMALLLLSCADVVTGPWQRARGTSKGPKGRCGETQVQPFLTTRCSSLSWYPGAGAETPASSASGRFASLKLCPPERHQAESAQCSPLGPKAKELGEP